MSKREKCASFISWVEKRGLRVRILFRSNNVTHPRTLLCDRIWQLHLGYLYGIDANTQTTDYRSNTKMSLNLVSPSFPCSPVRLFSRVSDHTPSLSYFKIEHVPLNPKARNKRNAAPPRKCALRASTLETDVARRSANYSPTVWDFDFIQSLTSAYKVIIPIHFSLQNSM